MKTLRVVATIEATTLLALIGAAIVHRLLAGPDWTATLGPVHGLVFVAYAALVIHVGTDLDWSFRRIAAVIAAAVIPAGGYVVAEHLLRPVTHPASATRRSST